ncbi:MAG: alpha/beta fold hydrolase [Sandaracinaceae bacterium]
MPALSRRPFLGIRVRPQPAGLRVTELHASATAAQSGVRVDDVLVRVNGSSVRAAADLVRALRVTPSSVLEVLRGGASLSLDVRPVPYPAEPGCTLGEVRVEVKGQSQRWRTLTTTAADTEWAVLFLGGIHVDSMERHGPLTPLGHVLSELARFAVTVRVERGVGDSEGPGPDGIDFDTEHGAYERVIDELHREGRKVLLLGHSIGGMHAPRLAAEARVVFGTSAARWSHCLRQSTRRQMRLRDPDADTESAEAHAVRFDTDALRERPAAFHTQLEALDLTASWRACREPARVLHGDYDWVVGREESEAIAAVAPHASFVPIDNTDHAFSKHASLEASLRDYGRGVPSQAVVDCIGALLAQNP